MKEKTKNTMKEKTKNTIKEITKLKQTIKEMNIKDLEKEKTLYFLLNTLILCLNKDYNKKN